MIEWVISDPESNPEERDTALDLLIRSLIGQAKKLGYQSIFISTAGKNWIERLKQHGFVNSQENMANLVLNI